MPALSPFTILENGKHEIAFENAYCSWPSMISHFFKHICLNDLVCDFVFVAVKKATYTSNIVQFFLLFGYVNMLTNL